MIKKGDRLCVALSGGPDSTALLHILNSLKSELDIELSACHVNHLLRGKESDGDARFAAGFCERLSIPIHTARVDVKKYRRLMGGSVQSAARELRYMVFKRIFRNNVADRVATAHVADDDTETVLINFLRGAGPQGLSGIPPVRGKRFIRPLIDVHKEEVLEYLERERIPYREDSSNMDAKYLRNALRKSLIPIIEKEFNPGLTGTLHRSAAVFDDIQRFLTRQAEDAIKKIAAPLPDGRGLRIDCSTFALMDRALQREVIKNIMIELRKSGSGISFENVESLRNLANGKITAGDVLLPGIRASVSHGKFYVSKEGFTRSEDFCYSWPGKRSLLIKELNCRITMEAVKPPSNLNLNGDTVYLDGDAVLPEAVFRNRREGDRFRPLGGSGSQKLKQFFIDKKIPRWERDSILLLASGSDILWIAGYRLSEGVRVGKDTKNVLRLKIEYEPRM
jgi:tRNA(Ile)-lysidine synthase